MSNIDREELNEMIERWRDASDYARELGYWHESDGIGACADELEALLNDE